MKRKQLRHAKTAKKVSLRPSAGDPLPKGELSAPTPSGGSRGSRADRPKTKAKTKGVRASRPVPRRKPLKRAVTPRARVLKGRVAGPLPTRRKVARRPEVKSKSKRVRRAASSSSKSRSILAETKLNSPLSATPTPKVKRPVAVAPPPPPSSRPEPIAPIPEPQPAALQPAPSLPTPAPPIPPLPTSLPIPAILLEGDEAVAPAERTPEPGPPPAPEPVPATPAEPVLAPAMEKADLPIPPILLEGDGPAPAPAAGPGFKYAIGPSSPPEAPAPAVESLPDAYGTGTLWLMARDPHCLFAHWDLAPEQQRRYNALSADRHLVVRVHAVGLAEPWLTEVHAHPESQHWFLHVERAGTIYVAELGYYGRLREWISLATSQAVKTPTETVAEDQTAQFMAVPPAAPVPAFAAAELFAIRAELEPSEPVSLSAAIPTLTLALESTGDVVSEATPVTRSAPSTSVQSPADTGVSVQEARVMPAPSEWTPAQEQALAQIVHQARAGQAGPGISSAEVLEVVPHEGEWASLAAARLPVPAVAVGGLSSPVGGGGPTEQPRDFWFTVNAELILYGATEPTAKVTVGGRPVRLRPDGTFSCRFSLPDGDYELSLTAVALHGDQRQATLNFGRHTRYVGRVGAHPQDPALKRPAAENM